MLIEILDVDLEHVDKTRIGNRKAKYGRDNELLNRFVTENESLTKKSPL